MSDGRDSPFEPVEGETAEDPAADTGSPSRFGGPVDRLFDGSVGGPSVNELNGEYGIGREWSIALRGIIRVATGDGIPPAAEILLGSVMGFYSMQGDGVGSDSGEVEELPEGSTDL